MVVKAAPLLDRRTDWLIANPQWRFVVDAIKIYRLHKKEQAVVDKFLLKHQGNHLII